MRFHIHFPEKIHIVLETVSPAELGRINTNLTKIHTTMATITERLAAVETAIDEAATEIVAEIEKLKAENLSPEGEATLARLETKATALKNIVPDAPPADPA